MADPGASNNYRGKPIGQINWISVLISAGAALFAGVLGTAAARDFTAIGENVLQVIMFLFAFGLPAELVASYVARESAKEAA